MLSRSDTYKSLTICSKDIVNGQYRLPRTLNAHGMKITSVFFVNIFPTVTIAGNHLLFKINPIGTPTYDERKVTLPLGTYTATDMVNNLKYALNNIGAGFPTGWLVTLDPALNRITIESPTHEFQILNTDDVLPEQFGYSKAQPAASVLTGNAVIDFSPVNNVHIYSQRLGNRLSDNVHSSYPNEAAILKSVHVTEGYGNWVSQYYSGSQFMEFNSDQGGRAVLDSFDFSLRDEKLNVIDFLGIPYYIELAFI